jgi:hypothetical protein
MFWVLFIIFGIALLSFHSRKGQLHRYSKTTFFGDLAAFSIFGLILVIAQVPVFDPRTGEYAEGDAYGRLVFGLILFSVIFGATYCVLRMKGKR